MEAHDNYDRTPRLMNILVDPLLKTTFADTCKFNKEPMSKVLTESMKSYIEENTPRMESLIDQMETVRQFYDITHPRRA